MKISKAETKQVPAKTAETEDADDSKFDADGKTPNVKAQTEQLDQLKASDGHRNNGEVETEAPQSLHLAFKKISGEADIQRDKATTPATNAVATTTPDAAQAVSTQQTGAISHTAAVTANSVPAYTNAGAAIPVSGLAFEIAAQAREGKSRFEIRLDPPELGRINVRLNVDNDGNVTSHLIVDRADTLDLLRRDASNLERALQDSGLKTSGNALEFSLRDQSMPQRQQSDLSAATTQTTPTEDTVPVQALRRGYGRMLGLGSGLDIQV